MAGQDQPSQGSSADGPIDPPGEAQEFSASRGIARTPLFLAQHSERYARQSLIRKYEEAANANLIVVIDQIFLQNMALLEELIFDCDPDLPLHVLLASPGGDGETAIRMVRSMQSRCSELTILVPDMAKSAATLLCLGADRILMGPAGDLGPVDPQFQIGGRNLASAKEIVAAIDEAERRVKESPSTFPLFSGLLADVNMLMVEQARSALDRTEALVREALGCCRSRTPDQVEALTKVLKAPLIDEPTSHSAVIDATAAAGFGLPVESIDPKSETWSQIWGLWTRYYAKGCWPAGPTAIYEGRRASQIFPPV